MTMSDFINQKKDTNNLSENPTAVVSHRESNGSNRYCNLPPLEGYLTSGNHGNFLLDRQRER